MTVRRRASACPSSEARTLGAESPASSAKAAVAVTASTTATTPRMVRAPSGRGAAGRSAMTAKPQIGFFFFRSESGTLAQGMSAVLFPDAPLAVQHLASW